MSVPTKLSVQGSATLGPCQASCSPFPSADASISLATERTYGVSRTQAFSLNSPSAFVSLIAGLTFAVGVRFLVLRVTSGSVRLRVTSAAGALQVWDVSDFFAISNPLSGSEWTVVDAQGTANVELMIAGD